MKPILALLGLCKEFEWMIVYIQVCEHSMASFRGLKSSVSF